MVVGAAVVVVVELVVVVVEVVVEVELVVELEVVGVLVVVDEEVVVELELVGVPAVVTVSVPAELFQCWKGFQPLPNMPILTVCAPRTSLAGTFHLAVNVRLTFLVNDWLSQYCWNTLPVELWISRSTRPRTRGGRPDGDGHRGRRAARRARLFAVAFVVQPAVVRLAAWTRSRGIAVTEPTTATSAASAMRIDRLWRLADCCGMRAPSLESRKSSSPSISRFLRSCHQIDTIGDGRTAPTAAASARVVCRRPVEGMLNGSTETCCLRAARRRRPGVVRAWPA